MGPHLVRGVVTGATKKDILCCFHRGADRAERLPNSFKHPELARHRYVAGDTEALIYDETGDSVIS